MYEINQEAELLINIPQLSFHPHLEKQENSITDVTEILLTIEVDIKNGYEPLPDDFGFFDTVTSTMQVRVTDNAYIGRSMFRITY